MNFLLRIFTLYNIINIVIRHGGLYMKIIERISNNLTKKEKNHIKMLVESIVYIFAIIISVFAYVYGNMYIRMIPLLFILGIIGKIIFNRPVVTSIFSIIVSICFVKLSGITNIIENLAISFCMGAYVSLGEIIGYMLQIIIKDVKKKRKKKGKKVIISYITVFFVSVLVLTFQNYLNSNIFTYLKYENSLKKYLSNNYEDRNLIIVNAHYNFIGDKNFKFLVEDKNSGRIYSFIVYKDNKFGISDGILSSDLLLKNASLNKKLNEYMEKNNFNEKYNKINVYFKLFDNEEIELVIEKNVEKIDDETTLEYSKNVSNILEDLNDSGLTNEIEQVYLSLISNYSSKENIFSYIYLERYRNNNQNIGEDYEYIDKSLKVEFID